MEGMIEFIFGGDMIMKPIGCVVSAFRLVYIVLAIVDGLIAAIAFVQVLRIHRRNSNVGWTHQKIFHCMIGSSNIGYLIYFVLSIVICKNGTCWSHACGFIFMALPQTIFLSAFLLLLSFWVDLCHQATDIDDDEDYDTSFLLLPEPNNGDISKSNPSRKSRNCCSFWHHSRIRSRQKIVIVVVLLITVLAVAFSVLIWVGTSTNQINPSVMAQIYSDIFAIVILISGGGLACYGLLLYLKMSRVRSEQTSTDIKKVSVLAVVAVICFTIRALLVLCTDLPVLSIWHPRHPSHSQSPLLILIYNVIGSSIPSAVVLWVMREMPTRTTEDYTMHSSSIIAESNDMEPTEALVQQWIASRYPQTQSDIVESHSISSSLQGGQQKSR